MKREIRIGDRWVGDGHPVYIVAEIGINHNGDMTIARQMIDAAAAEILPLAIMRPLSGSGSMGIVTELIQTHGPDSFLARLGATAYASTETTFYVLAVYFGSVGVKKARHAVVCGLLADIVSLIAAVFICRMVFAG